MLKEIKNKLISSANWIKTFFWIITHRGNYSFGSTDIRYALDFFVATKKIEINNFIAAEKSIGEILFKIWPKISPFPIVRVGPKNDSGYSIAQIDSIDSIVSGGAGKNIDFELFFAETGTKVHICDPFVKRLPKSHKNISHYLLKFEENNQKAKIKSTTLSEFEKLIKLSPIGNNILKLDIEGSEVSLLSSVNLSLDKYAQIVIEVHNLYRLSLEDFRNKFVKTIENLTKYHHVVHFNSNNNGLMLSFGSFLIPEVFELTLLHRRYFESKSIQRVRFENITEDNSNNDERLAHINIFAYMERNELAKYS
jgi:hypothetical protein